MKSAGAHAIRSPLEPLLTLDSIEEHLLQWIGDRTLVLLGEAMHGTHDFYETRANLTKRLIENGRCQAVVVEADWPDAYRANRYVRGTSDDATAERSLRDFQRFPTWMWRNSVVVDFLERLRAFNASCSREEDRVGFYGMDLYSIFRSIGVILRYLDDHDPTAAARAKSRYRCFDLFGDTAQAYGYTTGLGMAKSCEAAVVAQLVELQSQDFRREHALRAPGEDDLFYIEQNARLVKNAEAYYRTMFQGDVASWNLRDRHMVETLVALDGHLRRRIARPKLVVWAHNSHLGDARATDFARRGEWNVGQLLRERHAHETFLLGFTTHTGTVTAASEWDGPAGQKQIRPALPESYEALFHEMERDRFALNLRDDDSLANALRGPLLERAIGVLYLPESERRSHYFQADLTRQFDAVLHVDETSALEPLERMAPWSDGEAPETYPSAL